MTENKNNKETKKENSRPHALKESKNFTTSEYNPKPKNSPEPPKKD
ncbi:hypothetical protein [Salinicoccus bachuensis]|uniref:Uncharacterized protein n=1 Tax=Salinicoccus bachuensis TaxID=3136731 RepID=A0ABZ3CIB8_9STAP